MLKLTISFGFATTFTQTSHALESSFRLDIVEFLQKISTFQIPRTTIKEPD